MSAFTNTGKLFFAALRRDRIKLPIWLIGIAAILVPSTLSVKAVYDTPAEIMGYVSASAVSVAARAFNGPVLGATHESIILTETFTFFTLLVALMNTLLVVRHTRQEEEAGRAELIGSASVGRFAPLVAALSLALLANVIIAGIVSTAYISAGLDSSSAVLAGYAMGAMGMVFASIAAIAAQMTLTARTANAIAGGSVGAFFLLRAVGDVMGEVQPGGVEVRSGLASMFSPMGLAREVQPFIRDQWWPILILVGLMAALTIVALVFCSRRDLGSGMFPPRRGPATAPASLQNTLGLAFRQQRGLIIGWLIGLVILAIALGSMVQEVAKIGASSKDMAEMIALLGGSENLIDSYLGFSMTLFGVMAAGYAVQAMQKLRSEEANDRLELILAGSVRRRSWLLSHVALVVIGSIVILVISGLVAGVTHGIMSDDLNSQAFRLLEAGVVQLPVVFVFIALVALLFALLPQWSIAFSWGLFAGSYIIMQLGSLLKLPDWVMNLSPFTHIPAVPAEDIAWHPLIIMVTIALTMLVAAVILFRRRDITTS
jgi:ABC-2 type transport system permease protein